MVAALADVSAIARMAADSHHCTPIHHVRG